MKNGNRMKVGGSRKDLFSRQKQENKSRRFDGAYLNNSPVQ